MRVGAIVSAVAAVFAATGAVPATGQPAGTPGFCSGAHGTTVVVDLTSLGGEVIVRCAPGSADRTGLDALEDAGFDVEGTTRFGQSAVCRIEGRPAANEQLAVDDNDGYRESCIDMPPSAAYWSYWSADNGGEWNYSQYGLQNRDAIDGGFEGWSFALNSTSDEPPAPGIDPVRPTSSTDEPESGDAGDTGVDNSERDQSDDAGGQTHDGDADGDADNDDDAGDGGNSGGTGTDDTSRGGTAGKGLPKPLKRDTSPAPTSGTQNGVEWSGGEEKSQEAASATSSESGSTAMPWVAAGVIGALAVLIGVTTVRRRRRGGAPSP